jgi:hypothetical protein
MLQIDCRWITFSRFALAAISVLAGSSHAADPRWLEATPIMIAQATTAPSADKIRAQSQRMREYRALLADPDSNVRLAALDEMLKSSEPALRELAFEAGFASADQNMRALALRARILSMKSFILESQNVAKLADEEWRKVIALFGPNPGFTITKVDAQTGNIDLGASGHSYAGRVAGQEFSFSHTSGAHNGAVRLRLTDGGVMTGTYSRGSSTVAVILTLQ